MLNVIPVFGWLLAAICYTSLAVPAWFLWNWLVPIYVPQMPELYLNLPFWHVVGIAWLAGVLKAVFLPSWSVSNSRESGR